jgi:hypothetical protein
MKRKLEAEYAILSFLNFSEVLGLKVKIGVSPYGPHGQQFPLSEDMVE